MYSLIFLGYILLDAFNNSRFDRRLRLPVLMAVLGAFAGYFFNIMHWKGAHFLLFFSLLAVGLLYVLHFILQKRKPAEDVAKTSFVVNIVAGILCNFLQYVAYSKGAFAIAALSFIAYFIIIIWKYSRARKINKIK